MALGLSTNARNAAADGVVDLIDAGAGAGTIKVYTGAKPANPNTAPSGTLLGTLTFSDPAFGAAATGVATAAAISPDNVADASGTAGWFRAADSNGNAVFDGTIGLSGSGADLIMNDTAIVAGGIIAISSLTYTQPIS